MKNNQIDKNMIFRTIFAFSFQALFVYVIQFALVLNTHLFLPVLVAQIKFQSTWLRESWQIVALLKIQFNSLQVVKMI